MRDNIIMLFDGGVYAVGRPQDVITSENISHVYEAGAQVITDNDCPHIVLVDDDDTDYDDDHTYHVLRTG